MLQWNRGCVYVCLYVCMHVRPCVCGSAPAQMDGSILMRFFKTKLPAPQALPLTFLFEDGEKRFLGTHST